MTPTATAVAHVYSIWQQGSGNTFSAVLLLRRDMLFELLSLKIKERKADEQNNRDYNEMQTYRQKILNMK